MSDGKTHRLVGAGTGAVVAGFRAKQQKDHHWWAEVAGGALGGYVGGQLPDLLEPAISSWHRDVAHSCTAGGAIIAMGNALAAFEAACRENAEKCRALPMEQQGDVFVLHSGRPDFALAPEPLRTSVAASGWFRKRSGGWVPLASCT
jgi:hypothetical protein